MEIYFGVLAFIYGAIFGSFYNVLIYRLPRDLDIKKGRSKCTSCNNTIKAKHLVPIFSWIFLKGRCGYCGEKISFRYPLIELIVGISFLIAYINFGFSLNFFYHVTFWSMLIIVTVIDMDFMYILDSVLLTFGIIIIVTSLILFGRDVMWNFIAGIVSFGLYLAIYLIAKKIYKKEAFGFGDVLLIFIVGYFLSWRLTYLATFFPFIVASVYLIIALIFGKKFNLKQEVPFGPFICVSAFILSLYGNDIMKILFYY